MSITLLWLCSIILFGDSTVFDEIYSVVVDDVLVVMDLVGERS